jgi:ATP phosphoribosyltransferase regulatory subunit
MSHPIPSGTRDVLPDENRELRAVADALRGTFEARGYGEVATPALEYDEVLQRGGLGAAAPAYRLFDEHGNVLVLRSDMTVPIARVAATRYANAEPPLRFQYNATSYRAVRPQRGHSREVLQAGIELIGAPAPDGTAEAVAVLCEGLDAVGLRNYRVGLGDASLYPSLLAAAGVPEDARGPLVKELATRDFVGLEREVRALGLDAAEAALLVEAPQRRGGAETLEASHPALAPAVEGLRRVLELLPAAARGRVILDLGLVRDLDYYTGAVFEVYDPALGAPLGGGGRYDDLLGRFGRPLPAVGFALDVEALHLALAGEEPR